MKSDTSGLEPSVTLAQTMFEKAKKSSRRPIPVYRLRISLSVSAIAFKLEEERVKAEDGEDGENDDCRDAIGNIG
ncbi:hypothetical protein HG531_000054 [Fusarium graminearum]|nr:hypothetical protein HG531_000054 [Fusarium graminearum]